jgi:hypothetical protein
MRTASSLSLLGALVVVAGLVSVPAHAEKSRRMTADAVKLKKLTLQKTVDADLDGDGRKELIGVCTGEKGVQLALIGEDADGAVVTQVAPPAVGKEVAKVDVKTLVPPKGSQQVVLEVYDETPDEKVKRVRVYGADGSGPNVKLKEIFNSKIERARSAEERPEWETDKSIIQYGDPRGGWYFEDLQDDGVTEILVRRNTGAQIIKVKKDDGSDVKLLTGVRETVWSWDADKAQFVKGEEHLNDFLPALTVTSVDASSAWVEPKELKELKAAALSEALQNAASDEAAADANGKAKDKKAKKEVTDEVKVDLSPYIKKVADGSLSTAWIENDEKGDGKGEWVELTLEEESEIKMVRLVLGCVDSKKDFATHNVPESFSIQFDNGGQYEVNRRERGKFDGKIVAFTDELVKLQDRPWAKTTLVFFDGKTEAKKVRVTLGKAIKQGKGNLTCISEISVH